MFKIKDQGFCWSWVGLKQEMQDKHGHNCQVWYTQRNGDSFFVVGEGEATAADLPQWVSSYTAIEWIDPEDEFGEGNGIVMIDCGWMAKKWKA